MMYIMKDICCAAIHDISGLGKCSLTVALPVLSACGVETSVLPTAVLSTHTGGFENYVYVDLTKEMLPFAEHWENIGAKFDAVYTGFLGSAMQIEIVDRIFDIFKTDSNMVIIDPVMGDHGKLYPTYTEEMAQGVAGLCRRADVLVPNMTEASRILGFEYSDGPYTKDFIEDILKRLCDLGPERVVLTGVWFKEGELGSACRDEKLNTSEYFMQTKIPGYFHGTGDLFASTLVGGLLCGADLFKSADIATQLTWKTIVTTANAGGDLRFGPKFEVHIPWLSNLMEKTRNNLHN